MIRRLGLTLLEALIKEVIAIKEVVAVELPEGAVKLVRPALGDHLDVCAGVASGAGIVLRGLNFEFLN